MRVYRQDRDRAFLEQVYEPLKRFHAWYFAARRLPSGLFYWEHPYESGLDNSPRFSDRPEHRFADTTKLAAIDLSSYLVLDSQNMAEMAEALGKGEDAAAFRDDGARLKDLINARLWDEESKSYFDRREDTGEFVRVLSIASLTPLVAGVPPPERAKALVAEILDPRAFNTKIPFPSVARDDPSFQKDCWRFQKDCWRGPVWVNMAYLTILGMELYGYGDEARELTRRLVDGVYKTRQNTGQFVEFYDPDRDDFKELTRKKGNLYKRLTLGNKPVGGFVGWTGLVNNLAVEHLGVPVERGAP
jgi:putative isomerase